MPNSERRPNFKLILGGVATGTLTLLGSGCASSSNALNLITPTAVVSEIHSPALSKEVLRKYPEIEGMTPRSIENMITDPSSSTTIINLTDFQLNAKAASDAYSAVKNYLDSRPVYYYRLDYKRVRLNIAPLKPRDITLVFVPSDTKIPQWGGVWSAATRIDGDTKTAFTYVRVKNSNLFYTTPQTATTDEFATEVAQELIKVVTTDENGMEIKDSNVQDQGQELVCNSFGRALGARLLGLNYEQYRTYVDHYGIGSLKDTSINVPVIVFSAETYNSLPTSGPILK